MLLFGKQDFLKLLAKSIGLDGLPVAKIVIDASVDDIVKVYVVQYLDENQGSAMCGVMQDAVAYSQNAARTDKNFDDFIEVHSVKDVSVDDRGEVKIVR